jgi:hypothetical protein
MAKQKVTKAYYAIIPARVRYCKNLTPNAKLLYGEITALCNERGYCWANNRYFAELYGVSKGTISRWVSALVSNRFIKIDIKYKKGYKEIEHRYIYLSGDPIHKNEHTPIHKNVKNNTTVINKAMNNTSKTVLSNHFDKQNNSQKPKSLPYSAKFEEFWKAYPVKRAKKYALYCYKKAKIANNILLPAIKDQSESDMWRSGFIPNPSTWLNQGRWDDEVYNKPEEEDVFQKVLRTRNEREFK